MNSAHLLWVAEPVNFASRGVCVCGRGVVGADMAFLMMLYRLHSYCKLQQLALFWGQSADRLCRWTNYMTEWVVRRWGHCLNFSPTMAAKYCDLWAAAIARKMDANDITKGRLIGFLDGTFRYACHGPLNTMITCDT